MIQGLADDSCEPNHGCTYHGAEFATLMIACRERRKYSCNQDMPCRDGTGWPGPRGFNLQHPGARAIGRVAEKLLTAVGIITSADNAAIWARDALAAKNRLAAGDAKLVEDAFERRLSELAPAATVGAGDDLGGSSNLHDKVTPTSPPAGLRMAEARPLSAVSTAGR